MSEFLALRASLHVFLDAVEHLKPVVLLVNGFVSEVSTSRVVPVVAIMNLLHHFLGFVQSETS